MAGLSYRHVDVFTADPFAGNSLAVFLEGGGLSCEQMLRITQELRHFESVFLEAAGETGRHAARIFDLFEELPFAGHPILGAAAALHDGLGAPRPRRAEWRFDLAGRSVTVTTERSERSYYGLLDQGPAEFLGEAAGGDELASLFALSAADLYPGLPLEVVSTGLRYLIVPVRPGVLAKAAIRRDLSEAMDGVGAKFAVLHDVENVENRHWNNDGIIEDVATGSAAGTVGAYRLKHGLAVSGEPFVLHQGQYTGRPSRLTVEAVGTAGNVASVRVGGDVAMVGHGFLEAL